MSRERKKVLEMLAEGKITPDDAERLLGRLDGSDEPFRFNHTKCFQSH